MDWIYAKQPLAPEEGEIHVWRVHFEHWRGRLADLRAYLSSEEIERARRFLRDRDRDRYVFAHGILRWILGVCGGRAPADLEFESGEHGKPYLPDPPFEGPDLEFNLSHSGDCVLVGTSFGNPLGVDVEHTTRTVEFEDLSERFFSVEEATVVRQALESVRRRAFFDTWVCKEAFIKAVGQGLTMPLDSFAIRFNGLKTGVTEAAGKANDHLAVPWFLERFEVAEGYVGAVAAPVAEAGLRGFLLE